MGNEFFQYRFPQLIKAMEGIQKELARANDLKEKELASDEPETVTSNTRYIAVFHPQKMVNGAAVNVNPLGDATADVTEHLMGMFSQKERDALRPYTYKTDHIRFLPGVPGWWGEWTGPCYVEVIEKDNEVVEK